MSSGGFGYGAIDELDDPAWYDHADDHVPRWWHGNVARALLIVAAFVAGAAVVWFVDRAGNAAPPTLPAAVTAAPVTPATEARSRIVPPPLDRVSSSAAPLASADRAAMRRTPAVAASGWAPVDATRTGSESGRLHGDLAGLTPALRDRLDRLALQLGMRFEIVSGWRTHREQSDLYRRFLSGTGNLAAVPGTSLHEDGLAADVYVDGVALASIGGATAAARSLGMHFPVPGEPWHVELIGVG